jgi:hypothetical protein
MTNPTDQWTVYECGYNARLQGCYRLLVCYDSDQELREWQRGWDDADLMLESNLIDTAAKPSE